MFKIPEKIINGAVRTITGDWRMQNTKTCYRALKWDNLKVVTVVRLYKLARKLMKRNDPRQIIYRFADEDGEGNWKVKNYEGKERTNLSRRVFSNRIQRIWSKLAENTKTKRLESRKEMREVTAEVRKMDLDWILWGGKESGNTERISEHPNDDTGTGGGEQNDRL